MRRLLLLCVVCAFAMPMAACGKKPKFLDVPSPTQETQQRQAQ